MLEPISPCYGFAWCPHYSGTFDPQKWNILKMLKILFYLGYAGAPFQYRQIETQTFKNGDVAMHNHLLTGLLDYCASFTDSSRPSHMTITQLINSKCGYKQNMSMAIECELSHVMHFLLNSVDIKYCFKTKTCYHKPTLD